MTLRSSILLCCIALTVAVGCSGPSTLPAFNLDRIYSLEPVVYLADGSTIAGGAAFVIQDEGGPLVVTPASVWEQPDAGVPSLLWMAQHFDHLELDTFSATPRSLLEATRFVGSLGSSSFGSDQTENLLLFRAHVPLSLEVGIFELDVRSAPNEGEVLFLVGCRTGQGPCEAEAQPIVVTNVYQGGFGGVPEDPYAVHMRSGAPVLTARGDVAGFYTYLDASGDPELRFCPAQAIRQRLGRD